MQHLNKKNKGFFYLYGKTVLHDREGTSLRKRLCGSDFCPKEKISGKPAMVVELKWNRDAAAAIDQIKEKRYTDSLQDYSGNILLVGISYDRKTRRHECIIEQAEKN